MTASPPATTPMTMGVPPAKLMMKKVRKKKMSRLYIHETDCHGQGCIIYEDKVEYYAYDDNADMRVAVEELINIGFINPDDVVIIKGEEIYDYLKEE